ncbi:hypothetical protein R6Q59_023022 [Mikania micrantha]
MGETKKPVLAMDTTKGLLVAHINHNPVTQLQAKYKELETRFKDWLAKQSLPVEAAVVTATSFVQGAAIRGLMGTFTSDLSALQPPAPPDSVVWPFLSPFAAPKRRCGRCSVCSDEIDSMVQTFGG